MSQSVLLIEDEVTLAKNMCLYLMRFGYELRVAHTGEAALEELETFKPDIIVLDFNLPGRNGLETLAEIRAIDRQTKVIMITAHGSIDLAVEAMKAGAYDFLTKPLALTKLRLVLQKATGDERREQALSYYQSKLADEASVNSLLGESPAIRQLRRNVRNVLEAEEALQDDGAPAVLILGETGTGKELVARALHFNGPRRDRPFVEINCAAVHPHLLESELFGHERGAFTDAHERKFGLFETADGGTLFLDEIGDMDVALQARVLKAIEEKTVRRLGSIRDQRVNVRILAGTHRCLETLSRQGRFRTDLYFRLRVVQLNVPPLRERGNDVVLLARHFLRLHGARYGRSGMTLNAAAEELLRRHRWPGNVRELRNLIEQAVLLCPAPVIDATHLNLYSPPEPLQLAGSESMLADGKTFPPEGMVFSEVERQLLLRALNHTDWNVTQAARLLGLTRDTLRYRIEKFGLEPSRGDHADGAQSH